MRTDRTGVEIRWTYREEEVLGPKQLALPVAAAALVIACSGSGQDSCLTSARTTEAGLTMRDVRCGSGPVAKGSDIVDVAYRVEIAGARARSGTFRFRLGAGQVIAAFDEGIGGMRVGGRRHLEVPPELAFGESGVRGLAPPGASLAVTVTLLDVEPP